MSKSKNKLMLWLISQTQRTGYDCYDSAIVCAYTEEDAKKIPPCCSSCWGDSWAKTPKKVKAVLIGIAAEDIEEGEVIISSYNAG